MAWGYPLEAHAFRRGSSHYDWGSQLDAISTYPFLVFKRGWEHAFSVAELPVKGDIIVGHDVWFGYGFL
ncbi:MAG: hypothetical protein JSS62_02980 [Verrucomicrobia bacterium]|nr:hypothetical protein [Verrucomicrobiota bacterium]MBS0646376.1 hypothetical protein [Verrucomicrobiota bacterium]